MPSDLSRAVFDPNPSIKKYRTADVTLTLVANGAPVAGQEVVVAQRDHKFRFGCIGFEFLPLVDGLLARRSPGGVGGAPGSGSQEAQARTEGLAGLWFDLFNFVTLPFYWGCFEGERGRPQTERLRTLARWFVDRGCPVKGHPLVWHTATADWLKGLSNAEIARVQVARIQREVAGFAGLVDMWDVINEVVIMPIYDRYDNGVTRICREMGRIPMVRMVFDAARDANPHATLLVNDFDLSAAYECLIEGVLEAGIKIDVLGLQSHMHQGYWGEEKTLGIVDRFARYGLPIHFTETTLVSGHLMPSQIVDLNDYQPAHWPTTPDGEARQADEIVRHYRTLLSHPSVEAITYWGFADRTWLGAPGGLVGVDGTPKPSYEALHSLVKGEWWLPPTRMVTDPDGRIRFTGFLGEYEVSTAEVAAGTTAEAAAGTTAEAAARFRLDAPGEATVEVAL